MINKLTNEFTQYLSAVRSCVPNYRDIPVRCADRNLLIESVNQLLSLKTLGYSACVIYRECVGEKHGAGSTRAIVTSGDGLGRRERMFSDSVCIRNSRSTHKLEPQIYPLAF